MHPEYSWGTAVLECRPRHLNPDGGWREKSISPHPTDTAEFLQHRNSLAGVTGCHLARLVAQKGLRVVCLWGDRQGLCATVPGHSQDRSCSESHTWDQPCPGARPLSMPLRAVFKDNQPANTCTEAEAQRDEAHSVQAL